MPPRWRPSYQLPDVADARRVCDPSLPAGEAIWVGLHSQPRCVEWGDRGVSESGGACSAVLLHRAAPVTRPATPAGLNSPRAPRLRPGALSPTLQTSCTRTSPCPRRGVYLVAPDADSAEGWVDALLLLAHLAREGRLGGVKAALSVRR